MKSFTRIGMLAAAALLVSTATLSAQVVLTPTTLSAAIADGKIRTMVVASATPNASTPDNFAVGTSAYIDAELVTVTSVSSTTIGIIRGQGGTFAAPHASGAYVVSARPNLFSAGRKQGKCTRSSELVVPVFNVKDGTVYDCLGGQWTAGDTNGGTQTGAKKFILAPDPGAIAYTSLNTNGTAVGATTLYCTEAFLPTNKLLTGIGILNGTTTTANARYVILYDSAGNAIANSALTGQASVTVSIYENYAFTKTYFAVGPAQYFACLQDNAVGSTTVRMVVTGIGAQVLTAGQANAVFGTVPALTVPTTFTTAVGPYSYLY